MCISGFMSRGRVGPMREIISRPTTQILPHRISHNWVCVAKTTCVFPQWGWTRRLYLFIRQQSFRLWIVSSCDRRDEKKVCGMRITPGKRGKPAGWFWMTRSLNSGWSKVKVALFRGGQGVGGASGEGGESKTGKCALWWKGFGGQKRQQAQFGVTLSRQALLCLSPLGQEAS